MPSAAIDRVGIVFFTEQVTTFRLFLIAVVVIGIAGPNLSSG